MRVYEFSKKYTIQSKELLRLLNEQGFKISSHMSLLTDEMLAFLNKKFNKEKEVKKKEIKPASKKKEKELTQDLKKEKPVQNISQKRKNIKQSEKVHPPQPLIKNELNEQKKEPLTLQAMSTFEFSDRVSLPVNEVILTLLKWGILSNKNQLLPEDIVKRLADHYEITLIQPEVKKEEIKKAEATKGSIQAERFPVIAVLGHVDHGKTTLLDFIRKTRVASREKGGITQHLGAYLAHTKQGDIVFLDTPGHEAFSKIRARGVKVADMVILVIAGDDGVMPQTVEAIKHAKEIDVPVIVAVNKIDKAEASQIEAVKRDLAQYDLLPEEWGGSVVVVPISAKLGTNVSQLLEMIVLQSQLMELKANPKQEARGYVLESRLEKGRGPVATFLGQQGTLSVGDYFICGQTCGKVSSLVDSYGKRIQKIGPSVPVQIAGFESLPEAGDYLEAVTKAQYRKARSQSTKRSSAATPRLFKEKAINIMIKTDSKSSGEALVEAIKKLSKKLDPGFAIVSDDVGSVSESDIALASDTNSKIFTLHVKTESNAASLAQRLNIPLEQFDIIYRLLERLQEIAQQAKEVKMVLTKAGEAEVRRVFDIKNVGVIAGCYVKDGVFSRDGVAEIWRDNKVIGTGKILSLQRDRKPVKEVHAGYECGFLVEDHHDFVVGDRVDCLKPKPEKS